MDSLPSINELMAAKAASPGTAREVIHPATDWLAAKLEEAGEPYTLHSCEDDFYAYSMLELQREVGDRRLVLEVKIAEINGVANAFANVHISGEPYHPQFPFLTEIGDSRGRERLLHYIADFLMSARV